MRLNFLAVVFLLIGTTLLHAQSYKTVRVSVSGGIALPQGSDGKPGPMISIEPGFRLTDNILLGLKVEGTKLTRGMSRNLDTENPVSKVISATAFTQFYLTRNNIRPFLCAGVGYSVISDHELSVTFGGTSETIKIGNDQTHFMLRAGIEVWHFALSADLMFSSDEKPTDFLEIKNAYPSFRAAFFFGGGLR